MANNQPTRRSILAAALAIGLVGPLASTSARAADSVDAKVQASLDKALAFLKSQQKPDGGWQGEKDPPALTALPLRVFAQDPKSGPAADFVKKGYAKLLSYQLDNGGIYQDLLANYNTSIALSALTASQDPAHKPYVDRAVAYLKGIQWTDKTGPGPKGEKIADDKNPWFGGWGYSRAGRPDLSNAQMAIEALQNAGLSKDDPAFQNALKFITRSQNLSEKNDQKFAGDDGGFVYTPANDGESQAGVIMGPDGKRVVRSYGSMTYAGLKSMIYAGLTKDDPRVKGAWAWIGKNWTLDANPGMQPNDPKLGDMTRYGLYYYYNTMARALNVYDEPTIVDARGAKHDWRAELTDKLVSLQKEDGSWTGEKKWFEDNAVLATSYVALALQEIQKDLKEHPAK
ncbi:MAG TPA: prenyltransferase/squalene oxidase repeat-containing protein [Tepidisphaeraceae bacterium]|nr:prenyltransferase/squalene oxidase repeat-containing protein [Tepidisphaeraceae bacterium]